MQESYFKVGDIVFVEDFDGRRNAAFYAIILKILKDKYAGYRYKVLQIDSEPYFRDTFNALHLTKLEDLKKDKDETL